MRDLSNRCFGILGGMGPAATANFQALVIAGLNAEGVVTDSTFPKIITMSLPLREWNHLGAGDKLKVSQQLDAAISWLQYTAMVEFIAAPCNTIHEFIGDNPMVINIIEETLGYCVEDTNIGILCSRQTRESQLYERLSGKKYIYYEDQTAVDTIIAEVMAGETPDITPMLWELEDAGAEVVILGCTELSLCEYDDEAEFRVVDSAMCLSDAVVRRLLAQ